MILQDLLNDMNRSMRNNPGINLHEDDQVRLLNEHMEQVLSDAAYRFLIRRPEMTIYADYDGTAALRASFVNGSRIVTEGGSTDFANWMEGQKLTGPDGVSYRITSVVDAGTTLYLDRAYEGASAAGSADWSIVHDRFMLPRDCIDFLGISVRGDSRRVMVISPRQEEELQLDRDTTGDVTMMVDEMAQFYPTVDVTLSVAPQGAGTGSMADNTTYEYVETLEMEGRESAPTRVASTETTAATSSIVVTGMSAPAHARRRIYRRDVTNRGGWYLMNTSEPGTVFTSFTDTNNTPPTGETARLRQTGPTEYLRVLNRPSADTTVEVRYHRMPNRLIANNDAPEMPPQYQKILVWRALEELHLRHGGGPMAKMYGLWAEKRIKDMRDNYLDRKDRTYVRAQMQFGRSGENYRYGTPTIS